MHEGMAASRISFSAPPDIAAAAQKRASDERRSLSAYVSGLILADLRAQGLLSVEEQEKQELLAAADQIGTKRALAALLREARRRPIRAHA